VNDIICKLRVFSYGRRIAGKYVGILMYADDLMLISASNCDLRKMIEICKGEMAWLDMCFNVNKSCLLRCGPRYKKPCAPILLNGNLLHEWSTVKYLGVTFESGLKLKVLLAAKRMKFF